MNDHIDPKLLKPCPKCDNELDYIPAGQSKRDGSHYDAYYKCHNDCKVEHGLRSYLYRFPATAYKYYLKDKS